VNVFFFSSRRRHTRFSRDWSSDVCSSDLILEAAPDTKVIVLTGQNDQANALRAVALGAYDFFAKPFEPEILTLTVERAFRLYDRSEERRVGKECRYREAEYHEKQKEESRH